MINDAQIRQIISHRLPLIDPQKLEVSLMDYDAVAGFWYRIPSGTLHGKAIAIQRNEHEIAAELADDLASQLATRTYTTEISPYEGKRGKHPKICTCSKHKVMNGSY